ncbi:hypothetical protein TruAng_006971 [Truncatella angustata]|nr:hypothetical protein TruAng_006971 [Truncatella angustata]
MRLLNTATFEVEEFVDGGIPDYAILSHTWGREEVSLQDMQDLARARQKHGFKKVEQSAGVAVNNGYEYIWVDTCCIDKTSSAELSEAINSMYRWYKESEICYAYLEDCNCTRSQDGSQASNFEEAFRRSRWFKRGWTLQELIAPTYVEFYSQNWEFIGTKTELVDLISDTTEIDRYVLEGGDPLAVSVARKMSWAANRTTTRIEDTAYCLLGLFGVNMSLIYGEQRRAFARLQEEILKNTGDQTIFLWASRARRQFDPRTPFLAPSPREFGLTGKNVPAFTKGYTRDQSVLKTHEGIQLSLLIIPLESKRSLHLGVFNCRWGPILGERPAMLLYPNRNEQVFSHIGETSPLSGTVTITNPDAEGIWCFDLANANSTQNAKVDLSGMGMGPLEAQPWQRWAFREVTITRSDFEKIDDKYHVVVSDEVKILNVSPRTTWDKSTMTFMSDFYQDKDGLSLDGSIFIGHKAALDSSEENWTGAYVVNFGVCQMDYKKGRHPAWWYSCHRAVDESDNHWEELLFAQGSHVFEIDGSPWIIKCLQGMPADSPFRVSMTYGNFSGGMEPIIDIKYHAGTDESKKRKRTAEYPNGNSTNANAYNAQDHNVK